MDQRSLFLVTALATRRQKQLAGAIAAAAFLAFAAAVPFVRVPLAQMPAFIPSYEVALFFIDLITAVLLFEQFTRLRSPAVLRPGDANQISVGPGFENLRAYQRCSESTPASKQ